MKSRFQVSEELSEEEQPKQEAAKAAPAPAPAKAPAKSRFQASDDDEAEEAPPAPKPVETKEAPKTKPKSRFVEESGSEEDKKTPEPAKAEAPKPQAAKKPTRFAQEDSEPEKEPSDEETPTGAKPEDEEAPAEGTPAETTAAKTAAQKKREKQKAKLAGTEKEGEDAKKKKGKGPAENAALKKKIEERRKETEALKVKCRAVFADIAWDLRREVMLDLKDFAAEYRRKVENQKEKDRLRAEGKLLTKKQKEKLEKDERARKAFEESQLRMSGQPTQGQQIDDAMRGRGRRKPAGFRKGSLNEKIEEVKKEDEALAGGQETGNLQKVAEEPAKEEKGKGAVVAEDWEQLVEAPVAPKKEEKQLADVDDWEQLVEDKKELSPVKAAPLAKAESKTVAEPMLAKKESQPAKVVTPPPQPTAVNPLEVFIPKSKYRCPIICIMGHVDTGKTKLLDHIRRTNVQANEAGGITQQIGASFFPESKLKEEVDKTDKKLIPIKVEIPGLLIIDTPGHESFANLRNRGSSLCDFAIVVIDIMHGVENQTIESIRMLQEKGTPFVIALNKIDRLFQWVPAHDKSSYVNFNKQTSFVKNIFEEKYNLIVASMARLDINIATYWRKEDPYEYVPVVPTSAITGEGVPDLLGYIAHFTQTHLTQQITRNEKDFKATVLEVKKAEGVGSTVDLIIVNGTLAIDEKIVMSGFNGPIDTFVKGLLTPHPMKELRVKNEYLHHQKVYGSMGVRLVAPGLENAIAGSSIFKYETQEQLEAYSVELQHDIKRVKKIIKLSAEGVGVAASSLGSLEALLVFLKTSKIPVSTICIGDVSKNDLLKVLTPFLQDDRGKRKMEYLTMLCFDVKILPEAYKFGEENGIKMVTAKIIYHLFDEFKKHVKEINEERKREEAKKAVFPCVLKQVAVFNKKDPIILGVDVAEGILRVGTPVCVPSKDQIKIGVIESIEHNKVSIKEARRKTGSVAIRIKSDGNVLHGRQFELTDDLVSILSREFIDVLKEYFWDDFIEDDWNLVRKLKPLFGIK